MKPKVLMVIVFGSLLAFSLLALFPNASAFSQAEEIKVLKKVGEIGEKFGEGEEDYFWHIDDLCCDNEGNLYVADSGWNKIFKFSPEGKFLGSFGREGQGPGEFMANPRLRQLRITFGNDGKFYVYNLGNNRLSIFSRNFEFIKAQVIPFNFRLLDTPAVNSDGDIYLVARIGHKLIHHFNKNLELKSSFLEGKEHFQFPFHKPEKLSPFVGEFDLRKRITGKNHIIAVSNYALTVFHFNDQDELVNKFQVNNELFIKDFSERIKQLKKDKKKRQGGILPFYLFIDPQEKICLAYYNKSLKNFEIYRYSLEGKLIDVLRFLQRISPPIKMDNQGNIYTINKLTALTIIKYKIK